MIFTKRYIPTLCLYLPYGRNLKTKPNLHEIQVKQNVNNNVKFISKHLNISESEVQYMIMKHPAVAKMNNERVKSIIKVLNEIGLSIEDIIKKPMIFCILPITLKFRHKLLKECGIENVTSDLLSTYLRVMKQTTIGELKQIGVIPKHVNVENKLASYMTQWPTSLTTLINEDVHKTTLYTLRIKILQKYLQLFLDLTHEEFYRGIDTYLNIRLRPLECINESLKILHTGVMMPIDKIKSNLYLIHADPDNLKNILKNCQSLGGVDVREVIRMYPKIAVKSCESLLEIRKTLQEYGINDEAQRRSLDIYTLSTKSVRERLERAKNMPEFNIYFNHPRFLKIIYYKNTALKRLNELNEKNKKCVSLNILSGSSANYQAFGQYSGDKLARGKDLIFCISQALGKKFSKSHIKRIVQRHPFWNYTPPIQVKHAYEKLSAQYTDDDICENCPILLYPWQKVRNTLNMLEKESSHPNIFHDKFNFNDFNNCQKLSLVLYILEKNHSFSGNGVWLS